MSIKQRLKSGNKIWKNAKKRAESEDKAPEGRYKVLLKEMTLKESNSGKLMCIWNMDIRSGELKGVKLTKFSFIDNETGLDFFAKDLIRLDVELPDDMQDLEEALEELSTMNLILVVEVKHNNDFVNINIKEVLDSEEDYEDDGEDEEEEDEEDEDEEGDDESDDGSDGDDDDEEDDEGDEEEDGEGDEEEDEDVDEEDDDDDEDEEDEEDEDDGSDDEEVGVEKGHGIETDDGRKGLVKKVNEDEETLLVQFEGETKSETIEIDEVVDVIVDYKYPKAKAKAPAKQKKAPSKKKPTKKAPAKKTSTKKKTNKRK